MNLEESVFEISKSFMKDSKHVYINYPSIMILAEEMKLSGPIKFPTKEQDDTFFKTCLLELIGNSINYCYWYGVHDVRPGDASSTKMYELLERAFDWYINPGLPRVNNLIGYNMRSFIYSLSTNRFPLLEERINHLNQLLEFGEEFIAEIIKGHDDEKFDKHFKRLVTLFPGYSSDIFLKRASLFFLQLYRNFGWFKESMNKLHVPADYKLPRQLFHHGCIKYSAVLREKIFNSTLIPKHSREECEIRAATVLACRRLCELTEWNISDVDGWLWLNRDITNPFHLTITTDY